MTGSVKRILLVEDAPAIRMLLEDFLSTHGYQVFSLPGGEGFFEVLASFQPHLVLLNLKLPDVDGFALLEKMQVSEWRYVPVIAISALAFRKDRDRALALGVRRYLVKPMGLDELRDAIAEEF